jgi:hypothetical protein
MQYHVSRMAHPVQFETALACLESGGKNAIDSIVPILCEEPHRPAGAPQCRERLDRMLDFDRSDARVEDCAHVATADYGLSTP